MSVCADTQGCGPDVKPSVIGVLPRFCGTAVFQSQFEAFLSVEPSSLVFFCEHGPRTVFKRNCEEPEFTITMALSYGGHLLP